MVSYKLRFQFIGQESCPRRTHAVLRSRKLHGSDMGNFAIKTLKTFVSLSVMCLKYTSAYTLGSGKDGLAGVSTFSEFEFKSDLTSLMIQTARFFVDSQLQNHISYDANSLLICTFYSSMSFGRNIKQVDPLTKRGPRMSIIL